MADRIRVLQIIKTLNISGAEHFAIQLATNLDQDFYEVQVCAFFEEGGQIEAHWFDELLRQGIETWYAAKWRRLNHFRSYLQGIQKMESHLRKWPADIINTHFQLGSLAGLYCRRKGLARRAIRTAQNHGRKEWSPGLYGWLRHKLVGGWLYPLAFDAEVGVSRAIVDELSHNPGARFAKRAPSLITNAIPNDLVERAQQYPRPERTHGPMVVGSIGRLMPQKGYSFLLESIPRVCAAIPGVTFWIIGEGELRMKLEAQAQQLNVADHVQFLGRKTDVLPWLRKMDLFVLPSLWEGFPLVVMESMAAGVPVLATNIDGVREIIRDGQNGWLVAAADPASLADKIIYALQNRAEGDRLVCNALSSLEPLRISRITNQYDQLYRQLLNLGAPE